MPTPPRVVVLGAGTAGLAATRAALKHTPNVRLFDPGPLGTTCARVGCMPSKLLLAAAEVAHHTRDAAGFGLRTELSVDGPAVMARVRSERDRFVGFVLAGMGNLPDGVFNQGAAQFREGGGLWVGDDQVDYDALILAVGSRPAIFPFLNAVRDRIRVNDDVFDWTDLPESVAVFGPGVIGLELGQALHRLGVRVRVFGVGGAIGPLSDPIVKAAATGAFQAEFPLHPDAADIEVLPDGAGVRVRWTALDGARHDEHFDHVLAATGRRSNLDLLGLQHTDLPFDGKNLPVDLNSGHVAGTNVFVAGDATSERPLLHEASDEGRLAGDAAGRWPNFTGGPRRSPLGVVFSDPQIGTIGQSYRQLVAGIEAGQVRVGRVSFDDQGRSRVMRQNRGALAVYADARTLRLLGAEAVGPRVEHLSHLLAWAHQQALTIPEMLAMPFYHPVVEEGLRTALRDLIDHK